MDTAIFENKYTITTNMGNKNDELLITSVLDIFQTAAGKHANIISEDPNEMLQRGLCWVLVRNRVLIDKPFNINQDVYLKTYQSVISSASYEREYLLLNDSDEVIARGESKWCIIDINTGKIIPTSQIKNTNELLDQKVFEEPFNRIKDVNQYEDKQLHKVLFTDLDHNGHFNNTKYVLPIINYFRKNLKYIEMNFLKQAYLDDELEYCYQKIDNDSYFVFIYKNEELINKCYIKLT